MTIKEAKGGRTIAPQDAPVEFAQLFEAASMEAVRVPATGGFEDYNKANGSRLALARMRAAMKRSPHTPKSFRALLNTIEFMKPEQDAQGWHYIIRPMSDNSTVALLRTIVPKIAADEFWESYRDETVAK